MAKKTVAAFDFDGTLTLRDSFIQFAIHVRGLYGLIKGCIMTSPWLVAWKLHLCEGGKAKQKLFRRLYKGMKIEDFRKYGQSFATTISGMENPAMVRKLHEHINEGHDVYIVSASAPEWIEPWALLQGLSSGHVIGTGIETDRHGCISGRFNTPNCVREEKVIRLERTIGSLDEITLYAYGNSPDDIPLLQTSDFPTIV